MINAIRRLFYVLIFAAPLVMFSGTSELFEFNKIILIYLASTIIVTLWLIHRVLNRSLPVFTPYLWLFYVIFLATQILSTIFSIDIHTSLFGYYGRFNGGLLSIIAYLSLFFVFVNVFDRKSAFTALRISLYSSVIVMLWGLPGKFGHDLSCLVFTGQFNNSCWTDQFHPAVRMFSTLGQPNWLGAYLAVNFFFGLYFWLVHTMPLQILKNAEMKFSKIFTSYILYLYLVATFLTILFTRSRSSLAAVGVLILLLPFVYFFISSRKDFKVFLRKYALLMAAFFILIVIFKTGFNTVDKFLTLPNFSKKSTVQVKTAAAEPVSATSSEPTESFDIRKIVWMGAIDLGLNYPIFGTGVETFAYSYYFTRPQAHNLTSEWDFLYNKAHNEYLNYFATTGALGLGAYIVLISYIIILFYRKIRASYDDKKDNLFFVCLLLGFLSILITNFFGFSTTTINIYFYLIPAFLYIFREKTEPKSETTSLSQLNLHEKTQLGLVLIIGAWIVLNILRYYAADMQFAQADGMSRVGEYGKAATDLQNALSLHNEHVYMDKLSYALANLAFVASYQKEATKSAAVDTAGLTEKYMSLAKYFNQRSIVEAPKNVFYYKTTSKNDYLFYQISLDVRYLADAIKVLTQAEQLAPTDPKLPYTIALFYSMEADEVNINKSDLQSIQKKSLEEIDQAISLKPDYRDAYFLKGQLLKKYGRVSEGEAVFEYILKTFDPQDKEVLQELGK